jgi:hypothetical protein
MPIPAEFLRQLIEELAKQYPAPVIHDPGDMLTEEQRAGLIYAAGQHKVVLDLMARLNSTEKTHGR